MAKRRLHRGECCVGRVRALPIEDAAEQVMLDDEHQHLGQVTEDSNLNTSSRIVCMPTGQWDSSAAAVAMQVKSAFPSI